LFFVTDNYQLGRNRLDFDLYFHKTKLEWILIRTIFFYVENEIEQKIIVIHVLISIYTPIFKYEPIEINSS